MINLIGVRNQHFPQVLDISRVRVDGSKILYNERLESFMEGFLYGSMYEFGAKKSDFASGQNLVLPHFLISVSIPPPGSTSPETSCKSFKQFLRFFIANLMFNFQHEQSYLKKSDV